MQLGSVPSTKTLVLSIAPVLLSAYLIYRFSPPGLLPLPQKKRPRSSTASSNEQAGSARSVRRGRLTDDDESEVITDYSDDESHVDYNDEGSGSRRSYEYYCMFRPFFDIENENWDKDEDDQVDEDDLLEQYNEEIRAEDNIEMKPAAEHPEHRWIAMWETWKLFSAWERRASYTNPEFFNMQIHKHFHGHGMQEMIENMLIAFDKEFSKKKRNKKNLKQMWAIIAALMQWLLELPLNAWIAMDDRKRLETTVSLIGRAFATVLNELDRGKLLKADSDIKDLGLVVTFYLYWINTMQGQGFDLPFRKEVIAYGKKAGINFREAGCYGTDEKVRAFEKEIGGRVKPLSGAPKSDRWEWKRKFRKFAKENKIGGERFNILKMSRTERASYAFDKKDPLADISDKALLEGNVRVRPRGGAAPH